MKTNRIFEISQEEPVYKRNYLRMRLDTTIRWNECIKKFMWS